jgi:hypothetical protein
VKDDAELRLAPSSAGHPADVNLTRLTWYSLDPGRAERKIPLVELP